jgi:hypothetical protein
MSNNPAANCVEGINEATELALWLSPHIPEDTTRVLCDRAD